jgi:hypothetical protein
MVTTRLQCGCSITKDMFNGKILWVFPCIHHAESNDELQEALKLLAEIVCKIKD